MARSKKNGASHRLKDDRSPVEGLAYANAVVHGVNGFAPSGLVVSPSLSSPSTLAPVNVLKRRITPGFLDYAGPTDHSRMYRDQPCCFTRRR